jgi:hypothetical protein
MSDQKFGLGTLVATSNANARLPMAEIMAAVRRHAWGDWGDVCPEDRQANEDALRDGLRLFSVYRSRAGEKFWIITEADRSVTTVLFPEDY